MSAPPTAESSDARRLPPGIRARAAQRYRLATVRKLIPLRRAGMTWDQVAAELNRQNWRTFTGERWTSSSLSHLARLAREAGLRADPPFVVPRGRGEAVPDVDDRIADALAAERQ